MSKFKGFVLGAVVGTAGALLLAPKSGKELREDLKEKVLNSPWFELDIEYIEDLKNDFNELKEDLSSDIEENTDNDIVIDLNDNKKAE